MQRFHTELNIMSQNNVNRFQESGVPSSLIEKWTQIFHYYDVDDDGQWTYKDLKIQRDRLMNTAILTPERHDDVLKMMSDARLDVFETDLGKNINLNLFIEKMKSAYLRGILENVVKVIRTRMFYCCDLDGDGYINFEEFKTLEGVMGRSEMACFDFAFKLIDADHNGFITLDEYIDAFLKYVCDDQEHLESLPLFGIPGQIKDCTGTNDVQVTKTRRY